MIFLSSPWVGVGEGGRGWLFGFLCMLYISLSIRLISLSKGASFFWLVLPGPGLTNLWGRGGGGEGAYQHPESFFTTYKPSNIIQKTATSSFFTSFFLEKRRGESEYRCCCGRTL